MKKDRAIKVTVRSKKIKGERQILYLDFYPAIKDVEMGKLTRREFLGFYIVDKPKLSILEKQGNKQVIELAEQIRQQRLNEVNKPEVYNEFEKEQIKLNEKSKIFTVRFIRFWFPTLETNFYFLN